MTHKDRKHREFINRWLPVQIAYVRGENENGLLAAIQQADAAAGRSHTVVSVKALNRRIVRFRKWYGWFMFRLIPAKLEVTSTLGI